MTPQRSHSLPRCAIFVTGRTGSGKTTLANTLESIQYSRVSASYHLTQLFFGENKREPHTRLELAEFGRRLRAEKRLASFHDAIKRDMVTTELCTVDGLRFHESYLALSQPSDKSKLIILRCPEEVRLARLNPGSVSPDHETETAIDEMLPYADLIVDSRESHSVVFNLVLVSLSKWGMLK